MVTKIVNKIFRFLYSKRRKKLLKQYEEASFSRREKFKKRVRSQGVNPSLVLGKPVK